MIFSRYRTSFKKCFHHFAEDFHYFADDFHYFAEDFHFFVEDFQSQISKTPNDGSGEKTQNKISCEQGCGSES